MPLTKTGTKVLRKMQKEYGERKGMEVFHSSINKKKKGSEEWHVKHKKFKVKRKEK